jgi:hypothetical protein
MCSNSSYYFALFIYLSLFQNYNHIDLVLLYCLFCIDFSTFWTLLDFMEIKMMMMMAYYVLLTLNPMVSLFWVICQNAVPVMYVVSLLKSVWVLF